MSYNNDKPQSGSDIKKQQPGDFNKKSAGGNVNERTESRNAGPNPTGSNMNQSSGQRPDQSRSDIKNDSQGNRSKGNM